jgi:hypothetical protein
MMEKYKFIHQQYMSDMEVIALFQELEAQDMVGRLFYDGGIKDAAGWLQYMRGMCWLVKVIEKGNGCVGVFWLNGFQGRTAQVHFTIWKHHADSQVIIGKAVVEWLASLKQFDSLFGCTPKPYRDVVKLIKEVGFGIVGELPGACFIDRYSKYVPGVISTLDLTKIRGE